jgi:uncharacterized protein (TIGR01244 family)
MYLLQHLDSVNKSRVFLNKLSGSFRHFEAPKGREMSLPITCHNESFSTLGQIEPSNLSEIAQRGYKSVINNRPDFEGGPDQPKNADIEEEARRLGLTYAYLPVVGGAITREQAAEMARLLKTVPPPILAFCRSGARSTNLYHLALKEDN